MLLILVVIALALATGAQDPPQQPPLKSGVELIMVDAQVVDRKGNPISGLLAENFQVTVDGRKRKVSSVDFLESATGLPFAAAGASAPAQSPAGMAPGNIYILVVDQGSFRPVNAPSVIHAAREFLKRAHANDYVGLISIPRPGVLVNPSRTRADLEAAIPRLVGFSAVRQMRQFQYSLADAIDVASRDGDALRRTVQRNCTDPNDRGCSNSVEMEMNETVSGLELQAARSLHGVREVVAALKGVPGRKIVVLLSAGLPSGDRSGGRLYMKNDAIQAGKEAVASGMLLYTLHLNTSFLDAFSPDAPSAQQTAMREASVYAKGLDTSNGYAGGTFLEVNTGADFAVDRVVRESSAYYLLGVEVEEADRDGRNHLIQVKTNKGGSNVRSRPSVVIPRRGT